MIGFGQTSRFAAMTVLALATGFWSIEAKADDLVNDYPTVTRADYIFGCMQVNGNSRMALERCACSIDIIAGLLTHDEYVAAETVMSIRLKGGESTAPMYGAAMKEKVRMLKLAQIEGELKCF